MKLIAKPTIKSSSLLHLQPDRFDKFHLYSTEEGKHWRYELTIVDRKMDSTTVNPCAVFLIPAGRETEYLYSSRRGLLNIAESAKCARLIAVGFQRTDCLFDIHANPYQSSQKVQDELVATVQLIAQHDGIRNAEEIFRIPFMMLDGIGQRNVIARGETETTGSYIVEEVLVSEQYFVRRLYFMRNTNVIQTEVYMMKEDSRKVNRLKLAFEYHMDIVSGFIMLRKKPPSLLLKEQALIVGLGGGGLHNFIEAFFKSQLHVTAIELDPGVVKIAKEHFGLVESEQSLKVVIGDGLSVCPSVPTSTILSEDENTFVSSSTISYPASSMSLIVIDVDSKDTSVGMSCPPISFISVSYLHKMKELLIVDGGMLIINVSARDPDMFQEVQRNVCQVFSSQSVFISCDDDNEDVEEALNVVIFAVLNINLPNVALPKGMDAVDRIYDAFDFYQVFDFELRGALEICSAKLKRVESLSNDDIICVKRGKKTTKKKAKGKNRKKS